MVSRAESGEGREARRGWGGGSVEVAARRRAGLRLPGDLPLPGGRPAGRGRARVELGGRRGGPKRRASSPPLCLAGLASAILGTVARPPWLPALRRSFYFLFPALEKLIELAGAGAGAGGGQAPWQGMRVGAKRAGPGPAWGEGQGCRARSRWKWRRMGLASLRSLPSSAVSAGLPGGTAGDF